MPTMFKLFTDLPKCHKWTPKKDKPTPLKAVFDRVAQSNFSPLSRSIVNSPSKTCLNKVMTRTLFVRNNWKRKRENKSKKKKTVWTSFINLLPSLTIRSKRTSQTMRKYWISRSSKRNSKRYRKDRNFIEISRRVTVSGNREKWVPFRSKIRSKK